MADLQMILVKEDSGEFVLYACISVGRGCERNRHRKNKVQCEDCVRCGDPNETLEQVMKRVRGGTA